TGGTVGPAHLHRLHMHTHTHIQTPMHACTYTYTHTHTHTHARMHTYIHTVKSYRGKHSHGGEVEGVKYDSLDRFLLYKSPVEIRCTLLGLMRTNLCASWAHN